MKFIDLLGNILIDFWRYSFRLKNGPPKGFAFLAHPRDLADVRRVVPLFNFFPDKLANALLRNFVPFTVATIYNEGFSGFIISIPMTGSDMLADKALALEFIKRAFLLAQRRGAKIIGLGSFTASITFGGRALLELKNKEVFITTGNTLTAFVAVKQLKDFLKYQKSKGVNFPSFLICAVVGASGSTGRGIAELILRDKDFGKYIFVGQALERLRILQDFLIETGFFNNEKIFITDDIKSIKEADIIFVTTSSHQLLINSALIKRGAIIYDITQPRNVSSALLVERPDVKVIDGGLVETPDINYKNVLGLPPRHAFACLAETIILSKETVDHDFIGPVTFENLKFMENIFPKYKFKLNTFLSFGKKMI